MLVAVHQDLVGDWWVKIDGRRVSPNHGGDLEAAIRHAENVRNAVHLSDYVERYGYADGVTRWTISTPRP